MILGRVVMWTKSAARASQWLSLGSLRSKTSKTRTSIFEIVAPLAWRADHGSSSALAASGRKRSSPSQTPRSAAALGFQVFREPPSGGGPPRHDTVNRRAEATGPFYRCGLAVPSSLSKKARSLLKRSSRASFPAMPWPIPG